MNDKSEYHFEWIRKPEQKGEFLFTFDGKQVFNLFQDYPYALTEEQKRIFDSLNPYWAKYFRSRIHKSEEK